HVRRRVAAIAVLCKHGADAHLEKLGRIVGGPCAGTSYQHPNKLLHTLSREPVYHLGMRIILPFLLILAACSTSPPPKKEEVKTPAITNEQAPDTFRVNLDTSKGPV